MACFTAFDNGTVYYDFGGTTGKIPIGYYCPDETNSNRFVVLPEQRKIEIGDIDRCGILQLSRMGEYEDRCKTFGTSKWPTPRHHSLEFRGGRYGEILDYETREKLCAYEGDPVGAAAAFICATYELHVYSQYQKFYQW